jgi:Zn-dependent peptidase ImmA (M78 family)
MVHELKHHYCDQRLLKNGQVRCGDYNANDELIEKAAEVFAAEFIYPSQEFLDCTESLWVEERRTHA